MKDYLYRLAIDQIQGPLANFLKVLLWILSKIYEVALRLIRGVYQTGLLKSRRLPKPVVCVGNITLGGAGKTPLVAFLTEALKKRNIAPAILTRGYMPTGENTDSDEVRQLRAQGVDIPVIIGKNRYQKALEFLRENQADVFLCDDGFQHWRLYRDLDIVVLDATRPFGNECLLPRGILREPVDSLRRAAVIVLTRADQAPQRLASLKEEVKQINPEADIFEAIHQPQYLCDLRTEEKKELSLLEGKEICAFSAIAHPQSFEGLLCKMGADVKKNFCFMDHYRYLKQDLIAISDFARKHHIQTLVTTQKDAVKLKEIISCVEPAIEILSLVIKFNIIKGEDEILARIYRLCDR